MAKDTDFMSKRDKRAMQNYDARAERKDRLAAEYEKGVEDGQKTGRKRQKEAAELGGVIGTPAAYVKRAGQFVGDKLDKLDAYAAGKLGMDERALYKKGFSQGLKDEGYKKGGAVKESKMMGKMGRGMAKAEMQKVADKSVKGHEKRMHKMASGGSVSKRADGCAQRGKTKGRMI